MTKLTRSFLIVFGLEKKTEGCPPSTVNGNQPN
jgi:hypothetical protein